MTKLSHLFALSLGLHEPPSHELTAAIADALQNGQLRSMATECISKPLNSPVDSKGHHTELLVPMTLCSLTAIDRNDWSGWNDI